MEDLLTNTKTRNHAGVSVVEALVALVLFAVFMTGAGKILLSHRGLADVTREHYTAVNIAKNRIELARTFNFDALSNFSETAELIDASGNRLDGNRGTYRRSTVVVQTNNVAELTVTVDIRNHKTLKFDGAHQQIKTFIAFHP